MAKASIGQRIRPVGGKEIDVRQSLQRIGRGGGTGTPGAPGVTLSDDDAVRVWRAQWSVKTNDFTMSVPVISIPPGWAFAIISMNVYAYAGYGGCGHTDGGVSSFYVLRTEPASGLGLSPIKSWGQLNGTFCPDPVSVASGYSVWFYWFDHPATEGPVTVSTTGLTIGGDSIKFYPNVPFRINPSMSRPLNIELYTKYGCTGTTFPGANIIAWGTYWMSPDRFDEQSFNGEKRDWTYFDPPHTNDGGCPDFPTI